MSHLIESFRLKRAGIYNNPLNTGELLPTVYGDLTDGASGIWKCPCIDTVNFVYVFATSEVISIANGNSITVYVDDVEEAGGNYTFDEKNNYESEGDIAIITFNNNQTNKVVSVRGKGKPTATGGATLMENIGEILNDFLIIENSFASTNNIADILESTFFSKLKSDFISKSYKAAGVIIRDNIIWSILVKMISSFLGTIYINGLVKLVASIDLNKVPEGEVAIIPKADTQFVRAFQKLDNIINRVDANYAYNYVSTKFAKTTDDSSVNSDIASINIFGTRYPKKPYQFYWCRDVVSVKVVQGLIKNKFALPLWTVTIKDSSFKRAHLDVNDIIAVTFDLYTRDNEKMENQLFRIMSIKPDYNKVTIDFDVLDTTYFKIAFSIADGTHKADGSIRAGDNRDTTVY